MGKKWERIPSVGQRHKSRTLPRVDTPNWDLCNYVMKSRRPLGNTPSEEDLALVVFSHANRFQADEKVLVPRSRGG